MQFLKASSCVFAGVLLALLLLKLARGFAPDGIMENDAVDAIVVAIDDELRRIGSDPDGKIYVKSSSYDGIARYIKAHFPRLKPEPWSAKPDDNRCHGKTGFMIVGVCDKNDFISAEFMRSKTEHHGFTRG